MEQAWEMNSALGNSYVMNSGLIVMLALMVWAVPGPQLLDHATLH